ALRSVDRGGRPRRRALREGRHGRERASEGRAGLHADLSRHAGRAVVERLSPAVERMTMKRGTTVYLYELAWILPSIALPVGMLAALAVTTFGVGIHLPPHEGRVVPARVAETAPFDKPGVVQVAPGRYEASIV